MTVFETERLLIRQYIPDDFENFFLLNGDEEIMQYIRPAQNKEQSQEFFDKIIKAYDDEPGLGRWAMHEKVSGYFLGSFAVIPVKDSEDIQLGYALLKEYWGKGFASESVKGGIDYVFKKLRLGQVAAIARIENIVSQKILLKNNFILDRIYSEDDNSLHFYLLKNSLSI